MSLRLLIVLLEMLNRGDVGSENCGNSVVQGEKS